MLKKSTHYLDQEQIKKNRKSFFFFIFFLKHKVSEIELKH